MDAVKTKIIHRRPILRFAGEKPHINAIDEPMLAVLLDQRLGLVGFVVPEVVLAQRILDRLDTELDLLGIF